MLYDLGPAGLGLLLACALAFGGIAHVAFRGIRWLWLIGAAGWLVGGLVASELLWGSLTVEEIQPIVDGLAFDESLLGGVIGGSLLVAVSWFAEREQRGRSAAP